MKNGEIYAAPTIERGKAREGANAPHRHACSTCGAQGHPQDNCWRKQVEGGVPQDGPPDHRRDKRRDERRRPTKTKVKFERGRRVGAMKRKRMGLGPATATAPSLRYAPNRPHYQ